MVENDISNTAAAKVIGVKPNTFSKKLNRINTDFTLQEMRTLCITYDLDANVFFFYTNSSYLGNFLFLPKGS